MPAEYFSRYRGVPFYRALVFALTAAVLLVSPLCLLRGQDEAAARNDDKDWNLDFKFQALRMFTPRGGAQKGRVYWYMLYSLENKSKEDREFYVSVTARSDRNKSYSDLFLPAVEKGIEKKLDTPLWGQIDRFRILSKRNPEDDGYNYTTIEAGEKRSCIAVFNKLDANANRVTIEISGLFSDLEVVSQEDGTITYKERARVLQFKRLGDEYEVAQDPFQLIGRDWIKRESRLKPAEGS